MSDAAELHRELFAAIERRDVGTIRRLFASESIHTSGDGETMNGPDPVIAEVEGFVEAFPDLTIDIRHQFVPDPSHSIIEYTFSGTHSGPLEDFAPTGRSVAVVACSVVEAEDGTIRRESDYYDSMAMLTQLGLAPS